MAGIHLLDRTIGSEYPSLATDADVRVFEQIPYLDRIAAASTYDAIRLGASHNPDAPAIQFLPNADPADTPLVISHRDFFARADAGRQHVPCARRRQRRRRELHVAAVAGSVHHAVRRRSRRHRQSGQPVIGAAPDRGNPGSRGHDGAGGARTDAGHRHLAEGRAGAQTSQAPEGDRAGRAPAIPQTAFTRSPS